MIDETLVAAISLYPTKFCIYEVALIHAVFQYFSLGNEGKWKIAISNRLWDQH